MGDKTALILSGGGARAAYQVGVLKALKELLPCDKDSDQQKSSSCNPFDIFSGTSAGAINAISLATNCDDFYKSIDTLMDLWAELELNQVFRVHWRDLYGAVFRIVRSFFHEGVDYHRPLSLLDNSPLNRLLKLHIPFANIQKHIDSGELWAVSVAALGYNSSNSVNFFQGNSSIEEWKRFRRIGRRTEIGMEHLLASSAIPGVFPTTRIGQEYFGDGAMRQMAPISPALHLGANRVFIVGVSSNRACVVRRKTPPARHPPSLAKMAGELFNSAFIDTMESDIEHIDRVNELVNCVDAKTCQSFDHPLKPIKTHVISPSKALDKIAGRHIRYLPKPFRLFLRSTGATAKGGGSTMASYLLFTKEFTTELIDLGYQDAMWESEAIRDFFKQD